MTSQEKFLARMEKRKKRVKRASRNFKISPAAKKDIIDYLAVKFESIIKEYNKKNRKVKKITKMLI